MTGRTVPRAIAGREIALIVLVFAPLAVLLTAVGPIPQDPAYHAFADTRTLFGVPHFANVVSNVPFLVVGSLGLWLCLCRGVDGAARAWTVFFLGVLLVALGSGYYHVQPDSATLAWDRLPMTIAFMALFAALVAEHVRPGLERGLLYGAVLVGVASVGWWRYADDLRLYAWVQFAPLVALVFMAMAFPARYSHRGWLIAGVVFYALSKLAEHFDPAVLAATEGIVSGHSLKHLLAAVAPLCVYFMLIRRQPLAY